MPNALDIQSALSRVSNSPTFINELLINCLGWQVDAKSENVEDFSYEWSPADLGIDDVAEKTRLRAGWQIQPMVFGQPWGIFLLEFDRADVVVAGRGMTGLLRRALSKLQVKRTKSPHLPSWKREHLLFICTHQYRHYRFAYFRAAPAEGRAAPLASFGWEETLPARTVCEFNLGRLTWPDDPTDAATWVDQWTEAFDVETVTKRFFGEIANWYFWALKHIRFPKDAPKEADGYDHISVIRLVTRLMFCWFVKHKGLIPDTLFDERELARLLNGFSPDDSSGKDSVFYKAILQNLFFATLNTEMDKRGWAKDEQNFMAHSLYRHKERFHKPNDALDLFKNIPFLNGGLFECLDKDLGEKSRPRYVRIDGFSRRTDCQPTVPDFLFFGAERDVDLSADYGDAKYKRVTVRGLIHTLNRYNFTIEENTPLDQEVALDPELSGKVFENLLAAYNPETGATARKQTGSFYTPREIVGYMVDEALIAYLSTALEPARPEVQDTQQSRLRQLFAYNEERHQFAATEVDTLIAAIDALKALDPAVGSGAFPMGILHKLVFILNKLDPRNEKWKERQVQRVRDAIAAAEKIEEAALRESTVDELEQQITGVHDAFERNELDYGRKLYLIENCIYGVDIQPIAVQIAKMRFFISLIVDQRTDPQATNLGIRPLPNLETKFVAANTLICVKRSGQQLLRSREIDTKETELRRVRERHFNARTLSTKAKCRVEDATLRAEIADLLKEDGWDTTTARKLASWNPYDQNASAGFFDTEWMFGHPEGFDCCLGNPPYVNKQALQQQQPSFSAHARANFESARDGDFDLYALFIERSINLTRLGGSLAFIVPTGWHTGAGFAALRQFVAMNTDLLAFVNLPYDMFERAWVDTSVFVCRRRVILARWPRQESCNVSLRTFRKRERITCQQDFYTATAVVDIVDWFRDGSDEFLTRSTPEILRLLAKIRNRSTPLGRCADVQRGVTPFDLRGQPNHPNSRRAFDGTIRRYTLDPGQSRFIRFDETLAEFKPARYFEGPRILLRELISRQMRLQASTSSDDFITNKSIQTILSLSGGPDLSFLLGVLNSRLLSWYFLQRSNVGHRDDFPKIVLKETRGLPIPEPSQVAGDGGTRLVNEIIDLVKRILMAKDGREDADTSVMESAIDERLYSLFGLSPDEVAIVEETTPLAGAEPNAAARNARRPDRGPVFGRNLDIVYEPAPRPTGKPRDFALRPDPPPQPKLPAFQPPPPSPRPFPLKGEGAANDPPRRSIDDITTDEFMAAIREVFSDGQTRTRDDAIRDVARAIGFDRTGTRIRDALDDAIRTAVRRGILDNQLGGALSLLARTAADYSRDHLVNMLLSGMGGTWWDRDDLIRGTARYLGFRRTGSSIVNAFKSAINGSIRRGLLEADGARIRKK